VLWLVQHEGECIRLARTGSDKGDARSVIKDGEGKGDALWGRLGRVLEIGHPPVAFGEELMAWEKRAGVAILADPQEDEVKNGKASRILLGKLVNELPFVGICKFFEIVKVGGIDRVDVPRGDGNMVKQLGLAEVVV